MLSLAHIFGMPVEEIVLYALPALATGGVALAARMRTVFRRHS
jgi:hypothetical protein